MRRSKPRRSGPSCRPNAILGAKVMVMGAVVLVASQAAKAASDSRPPFMVLEHDGPVRALVLEASSLKDPFSVQFRNLSARTMYLKDPDRVSIIYCGELNAKNSMGAYVGWTRFSAASIGKDVRIAGKTENDFWIDMHCRDAPNLKRDD